MTSRLLLIEPGDEATRRFLLERLSQLPDVELVVASAVYSSSKGQWFEGLAADFISFEFGNLDFLASQAGKFGIQGVFTYFDFCLPAVQYVAQSLSLPEPHKRSINVVRKDVQREILAKNGLPSVRYFVFESIDEDEIAGAFNAIGTSCVVKPVQFTSSLGVRICSDVQAAVQAVKDASQCDFWDEKVRQFIPALSSNVLVEERVLGEEISVEGMVFQGQYQILGLTKKLRSAEVHLDELGHVFPHPAITLESELGKRISTYVEDVHRALGILNSVTHTEIILRKEDSSPVLVEVNCRPAGGCIPLLMEKSSGINVPELMVSLALGLPPKPFKATGSDPHSALFVYSKRDGLLVRSPLSSVTSGLEDVLSIEILRPVGSYLFRAGLNEVSRCALAIAKGAHEALPEMDPQTVDPFIGVVKAEGRTIALRWAGVESSVELAEVELSVWGALGASENSIKQRLSCNRHSTIMAVDLQNNECLGFLTQVPIPDEWSPPRRTWAELAALAADPQYFSSVRDFKDLVSFGVSIACRSDAPHGLGTILFKAMSSQLPFLGCKSFVGGIRMIGLRLHIATGGSLQSYLHLLKEGGIYNPIYGAIIEAGGRVQEPMSDYYSDYDSINFGLKVVIPPLLSSGVGR